MVYDKAVDHIYCHMSTMSDHGIVILGYKLRNFQLFHLHVLLTVMFVLNNEEIKLKFTRYCVCQVATTFTFCMTGLYFYFSLIGLFAAAHDVNLEWLIVKGISHFSDDSNTPDESWKSFASIMAASLVSNMLNDPVVFKEWPHYEGM